MGGSPLGSDPDADVLPRGRNHNRLFDIVERERPSDDFIVRVVLGDVLQKPERFAEVLSGVVVNPVQS